MFFSTILSIIIFQLAISSDFPDITGDFEECSKCSYTVLYIHGTGTMDIFLDPWKMNKKELLEAEIGKQSKERKRLAGLSFQKESDKKFGLHKIDDLLGDYTTLDEDYSRRMAIYYKNNFGAKYVFEWPEGLSKDLRKNAGIKLYHEMKLLEKKGISIDTILCHSHGGNVLAEAILYAQSKGDADFSIDNALFFETPIYEVTEKAVDAKNKNNNYYIKKVYNFVVGNDLIQVIDGISAHFPFNKRFFENKRKYLIQYKINDPKAHHNSFNIAFYKIKSILEGKVDDPAFEVLAHGRMGRIQSFFYNHTNKIIFLGLLCGMYHLISPYLAKESNKEE